MVISNNVGIILYFFTLIFFIYILLFFFFFFFNDTATTKIYTLSLHDALPISSVRHVIHAFHQEGLDCLREKSSDRKSTRLNSSHVKISYAVFCLKKKKKK